MNSKTKQIKALIESSGSNFMSITFIKKDKTERTIVFNPKSSRGLVGDKASDSSKQAVKTRKVNNPYLINVQDSNIVRMNKDLAEGVKHKMAWRSINANTVIQVKSGGEVLDYDVEL